MGDKTGFPDTVTVTTPTQSVTHKGSFTSRNVMDGYGNLAIFIRNVEMFVGNSEIRE